MSSTPPSKPSGRRLTRADWTAEALRALGSGGLASVAIEPIAARLGATKGSGYWHFRGRDDLIAATVARWEQEHTEAVIAQLDRGGGDASERLGELFRLVFGRTGPFSVELALLASAEHPLVAPTLRRATRRRVDYLTALFGELGFAPAEAGRRALLAYTTYLGHAQLTRTYPDAVPARDDERQAYLESVLATLRTPPAPGAPGTSATNGTITP